MATLLEIKQLFSNSDLQDKIQASLLISVQAILDGAPTADQQKYAAHVFSNPKAEGTKALMSVLATNSGATVSQIIGASDAAINTNVASVTSTLSVAHNAGLV